MYIPLIIIGLSLFIISPFMNGNRLNKNMDKILAILAILTISTGLMFAIGENHIFNAIFSFFILVGLIISPFYFMITNSKKFRYIIVFTAIFSLLFSLFVLYPLKYNEDMVNSGKIYKTITYKKHFNNLKNIVKNTIDCKCLKKTLWSSRSYYIILLSVIDFKE